MTSTIGILALSVTLLAIYLSPSTSTPWKSNSIREVTSLKSLLKSKDLSLALDKGVELELSDEDLRQYVPLAIEQLEAELLADLSREESSERRQDEGHQRAKRSLLLLKKKKLIIAKLLILKALFASRGHQQSSGGYGYAPSQPSHYGPPPTPEPSYGPPPMQSYGPPPQQGYGR